MPTDPTPSVRRFPAALFVAGLVLLGLSFAAGFAGGWNVRAAQDLGLAPRWLEPAMDLPPAAQRPALLPTSPGASALTTLSGASGSSLTHDPASYFRRPDHRVSTSWWDEHPDGEFTRHSSHLGLRLTGPLPVERPRPLIVLTGDSHMDGVCADHETAAAVAERALAARPATAGARVLNAATGMFTFPNYLGVAWRYLQLEPEAFVMVVYGGNDFGALEGFEAELAEAGPVERPPGYMERLAAAEALEVGGRPASPSLWQALNQIYLFAQVPGSLERAVERAVDHTAAIADLAEASGTRLLVVYLPPAHDVAPAKVAPLYVPLLETLELDADDVAATDRAATGYLAGLAERGVETLDARPLLRGREELLYWVADEHLDVTGQRILGEAIAERLADPAR